MQYSTGGKAVKGEVLVLVELGRGCFAFVRKEAHEFVTMVQGSILYLRGIDEAIQRHFGITAQCEAEIFEVNPRGVIKLQVGTQYIDLYQLGAGVSAEVIEDHNRYNPAESAVCQIAVDPLTLHANPA
jgi:hypothetical protein